MRCVNENGKTCRAGSGCKTVAVACCLFWVAVRSGADKPVTGIRDLLKSCCVICSSLYPYQRCWCVQGLLFFPIDEARHPSLFRLVITVILVLLCFLLSKRCEIMVKRLGLYLVAFVILFFFFVKLIAYNSFSDLEDETRQYVDQLNSERSLVEKEREELPLFDQVEWSPGYGLERKLTTLENAAELMRREELCAEAFSLYRQSLVYGWKPNAKKLMAIAEAAACDNNWRDATIFSFLAYEKSRSYEEIDESLSFLISALQNRTTYTDDWSFAARTAGKLLEKSVDLSFEEKEMGEADTVLPPLEMYSPYVVTTGKRPSLCLRFNDRFPRKTNFNYGDYIQVSPPIEAEFTAKGDRLCIEGAAYATNYNISVLKGLRARDRILEKNQVFSIQTGHREPRIWFTANAYVLPKSSVRGIGLHSMNVDQVRLSLYRIHERNIMSSFVFDHFRKGLDQNALERIQQEIGEEVWKASVDLKREWDVEQNNSLRLPETVLQTPGLYVLVAEDSRTEASYWRKEASQWLVVTDLGLTSYVGDDGLTVVTRSLQSGQPVAGIEVSLFARNNSPLSTQLSDDFGIVRFAPGLLNGEGGTKATLLMASNADRGLSFLELGRPVFDLSDRGVSGRMQPGPLDAYMYSDRAIYRPGETLNLVALLRDERGRNIQGPPLTLRLFGPDSRLVLERILQQQESGAYVAALNLPASAHTGNWSAALYADVREKAIDTLHFEVESFLPPRLSCSLSSDEIMRAEKPVKVKVQADYLYGAPASSLQVDGDLNVKYDPHPFADYGDYSFGNEREQVRFLPQPLSEGTTDERGSCLLDCALPEAFLETSQPLMAEVVARVEDVDGRIVRGSTVLPVRHLKRYVGIQTSFAQRRVPANSRVGFQVLVLDGEGVSLEASDLEYRLVLQEVDYQWFKKDNRWNYERIETDHEIDQGTFTVDGKTPALLDLHVLEGKYRFEVVDKKKRVLASIVFDAGEQVQATARAPDSVKLTLDKKDYLPGETAQLQIQAPFSGEASLVLAGSGIRHMRYFHIDGQNHTLRIPVDKDWGAGLYALVTVYRPGAESDEGAGRALGVVWIGVDPAEQRLTVTMEVPDKVRPRQQLDIPVSVLGAAAGEEVYMTLAAVDESVLQMTQFVSPDPLNHYFGKRQLGTEILDYYGQLIVGPDKEPLVLRSGAGGAGMRGAVESNVRVVSLFSGVVSAGSDGLISLFVPDFNGTLRLMLVAWTRTKLGATHSALRVSDPLVVSPSLPRFLSLEDLSEANLLLENLDGAEGTYTVSCTASGSVKATGPDSQKVVLRHGERHSLVFPLKARSLGSGQLRFQVEGPEDFFYSGEYTLNVRGKYLGAMTRTFSRLEPGASLEISSSLSKGLYPQTAEVSLGLSSVPNFDVPGLLAELDRYPYGCLEQLTSRALPLLYANELSKGWGYPQDAALKGRIVKAIEKILQKQRLDGSFGLWSAESPQEPWLTAYAMDFLSRAVEAGFTVPDFFYERGWQWLNKVAGDSRFNKNDFAALAYAHYLLARTGKGRTENARYLFDNFIEKTSSPLAVAHLSAALAMQGDVIRGKKGLVRALEIKQESQTLWRTYGSRLRDLAGIISLLPEVGADLVDPAATWDETINLFANKKYLSTQERAWLVMASLTLKPGSGLQIQLGDEELVSNEGFLQIQRKGRELNKTIELRNNGQESVWLTTTVQGMPIKEPQAVSNEFSLHRSWFSLGGEPVAEDREYRQGERFIVALEGEFTGSWDGRALLVDLLPAGFEIEQTSLDTGADSKYPWLGEQSPSLYLDARDDRYIAAFNTEDLEIRGEDSSQRFRFYYLVRAVIPGTYMAPPAEVEDMYQPEYRARTTASRVKIVK
ncbi:MAG: hypothetical protein CSA20_01440 [Deltaproteobacteria bacterium]|nr:MAG: hypothetical protein CSA20_01440 [Deltaproteobacteria bacterium]